MTDLQIGMAVEAYRGTCIGLLIQCTTYKGEIVRINRKSIRVRLTESTSKFGSKTTSHFDNLNTEITYRFSKVLRDGRFLYTSESDLYGHIKL